MAMNGETKALVLEYPFPSYSKVPEGCLATEEVT